MVLYYEKHASLFLCVVAGLLLTAPSRQDATPAHRSCEADPHTPCIGNDSIHTQSRRDILQASSANTTHPAEHKSLLPTNQYDVAMFVIAGIVLFVAAGAGMGGGPVLVPVYLTLGGFLQQAAVALSNSTILAGSVANVLVNARKRHPFKNRPLVDWDLILLMQPPTLIGAIAGSFINKLVPAWISHLLLAVLLTLMAVRVVQRATRMYKQETAAMDQQSSDPGAAPAASKTEHNALQTSQQQKAPILQLAVLSTVPPAAGFKSPNADNEREAAATHASGGGSSSAQTSSTGGAVTVQLAVIAPGTGCAATMNTTPASPAAAACTADLAGTTAVAPGTGLGDTRLPARFLQKYQGQGRQVVQQHHDQQQQHRVSRSSLEFTTPTQDQLPPMEAECRLAYAPPGHIRRNSWELQEGWDDAWESHDSSDDEVPSEHQLRALNQLAAGQGLGLVAAGHAGAAVAGAAKLLHTDRASSAPLTDTLASPCIATAGGGQQADASDTRCASPSLVTSSSAQCFGTRTAALPAAASPTASSDARAIIRKQTTADNSTVDADSRPSSVLSKYLKPHPRRQPPELSINSPELQTFLLAEAAQVPLMPVVLLAVMFIAVLLTSLFSKTAKCGGVAYWLIQAAVVPVLLGVWWFGRGRVLRKVAVKRSAGLDFHGDIRWTHNNSIIFPAICSFAGVMAGMFGLGGAVVTTPIMLELGVHPQVTAATSQTMLLLTTAASTIVYSQLGDIPWNYASVLMPMAFAATLAGQFAIDKLVARLRRSSAIVIVVAGFFVVACCLTYYVVIDSMRGMAADPAGASVPGKLCGK